MTRAHAHSFPLLVALVLALAGLSCREARRNPTPNTAPESRQPASPPADTDPSSPPPIAPPTDTRPEVPADVPTHMNAPGDGVPPPATERDSESQGGPEVEVDDGSRTARPSWGPPLSDAEAQAFESYAGFSEDGLLYAYVEGQHGVPTLHYVAVPTRTVEKVTPLFTPEVRDHAAAELAGDGFPDPTEEPSIPSGLDVSVRGNEVHVLFAGMPVARPFRPFEDRQNSAIDSAVPVALTPDGTMVAIRVGSADPSVEPVHQLVPLFE